MRVYCDQMFDSLRYKCLLSCCAIFTPAKLHQRLIDVKQAKRELLQNIEGRDVMWLSWWRMCEDVWMSKFHAPVCDIDETKKETT